MRSNFTWIIVAILPWMVMFGGGIGLLAIIRYFRRLYISVTLIVVECLLGISIELVARRIWSGRKLFMLAR